jgi:predicted secreted hydrolase
MRNERLRKRARIWMQLLAVLVVLMQPLLAQYKPALPGYQYQFPRDHFSHPDFQTEWWYYTGNVKTADGHRFGFELTFFREAVTRDPVTNAVWDIRDVYAAHLALSDLDGGHFYHSERSNRAGPGIAGVSESDGRIWNGNWEIQWQGDDQKLQAVDDRFALRFKMHSEKPPVIHGENGISQKGSHAGEASHYISLTRLATSGTIELNGQELVVSGLAWMDHEFFTDQLEANQTGWDWLSLQLDNNTEIMLFNLRRKDGSIDEHSAGTYIDANGKTTNLKHADFVLQPTAETWTSPSTRATYPIHWKIAIPRLQIAMDATTPLASQELTSKGKLSPTYWEGAITLRGMQQEKPLAGVGYLEMTGYDRPVQFPH